MTKFQEILSNKNDPVIMADENGVIQEINAAFKDVYGWSREELKGKMLTVIIPEALRDAHHMGFSRFLTTEKATILEQSLDLNIVYSDGRERPARHFITAFKENDRWVFAACIQKNS